MDPELQIVCDKCQAKFLFERFNQAWFFVENHKKHNYLEGLRIELVECPSPRMSTRYAVPV